MIRALLSPSDLTDKATLHRRLADQLGFPAWYGNNLDALYDCLTSLNEDALLLLPPCSALEAALGSYAHTLLRVLRDSAADNHYFRFILPPEEG